MTKIIRGFMEKESERGFQLSCWRQSPPENAQLHAACKQEMIRWQELVKEKLMNSGYEENKADELASLLHSMVIGGLSMTTALKQTTPLEHVKGTLDIYLCEMSKISRILSIYYINWSI